MKHSVVSAVLGPKPACVYMTSLIIKQSITRLRIDSLAMKTTLCYSHLAVKTENLLEIMMLLSYYKMEDIKPTIFAPCTLPTHFLKTEISHFFQENCGYIHNKKGTIPLVFPELSVFRGLPY